MGIGVLGVDLDRLHDLALARLALTRGRHHDPKVVVGRVVLVIDRNGAGEDLRRIIQTVLTVVDNPERGQCKGTVGGLGGGFPEELFGILELVELELHHAQVREGKVIVRGKLQCTLKRGLGLLELLFLKLLLGQRKALLELPFPRHLRKRGGTCIGPCVLRSRVA